MQVFKILGDRFSWTLMDDIAGKRDIRISYCGKESGYHGFRDTYLINRDVFPEEELIRGIKHWVAKEMKDSLVIYTERTIAENQKLIELLKELTVVPEASLNGHEFYFNKVIIFCLEKE